MDYIQETGEICEASYFKKVVAPRQILKLFLQDVFLWLKFLSTAGIWGFACWYDLGKKQCSYGMAVNYQNWVDIRPKIQKKIFDFK